MANVRDGNVDVKQEKIALVIGSGRLKCAAALGVWRVLREAGIDVDMAAGCSGGSLYATALALGYDQQETAALTQKLWTAELAQQRHLPSLRRAIVPRLYRIPVLHRRHALGHAGHGHDGGHSGPGRSDHRLR